MVSQLFKSYAVYYYIYDTPHEKLNCRILHYLADLVLITHHVNMRSDQLAIGYYFIQIINLLFQEFYCLRIDEWLGTTHITITVSILLSICSFQFPIWNMNSY